MDELSIKVKIAGRMYPLTIPRQDEEKVRRAARLIDEQFHFFREQYAVKDRADLLAMVALQIATANLNAETKADESPGSSDLIALRDTLRAALS